MYRIKKLFVVFVLAGLCLQLLFGLILSPVVARGAAWLSAGSGRLDEGLSALSKVTSQAWNSVQAQGSADVLLILAAQADLHSLDATISQTQRARFVRDQLWMTAQHTQQPLRDWLDARGVAYRSFYIVNMLQIQADRELLLALARRTDVALVMANPKIHAELAEHSVAVERLSPAAVEWGVQRINAPQVWDLGYTGAGIVVAGQDTGYDWTHPALQSQYRGWDGSSASHDYNWHDAIHDSSAVCAADSSEPCDDHGHGTHTMGTLVGDDGADNQIGVAPGAQWIGCRNMNSGVGTPASYAECFEFFLAPYPVDGDPSQGDAARAPDVINNSWTCPTYEGCDAANIEMLRSVVQNVRAAGIMVVVSAGNSGSSGCESITEPPSFFDAAYTVGATRNDSADSIADFSGRGPAEDRLKPDIVAPGVDVRSSYPGGNYGSLNGTSMASPHVAGAVALLWSARPVLRHQLDLTELVLNQTAQHITTTACSSSLGMPNNVYGWGRLDVLAALQYDLTISGTLAGQVSDLQAGLPLADALVEVSLTPTQTWHTATDSNGFYQLDVFSGSYTVTVAHKDFASQVLPHVVVTQELTTTLNVALACQLLKAVEVSTLPEHPFWGEPVVFSAVSLSGTLPVTFTWAFGDGSGEFVGNPMTHTFSAVGGLWPFSITLTATNACSQVALNTKLTMRDYRVYLPPLLKSADL